MADEIKLEHLNDNNWSALLRKLREENEDPSKGGCVLFLGPEALISNTLNEQQNGYKTMLELLCEKAADKINLDTGFKVECPGNKTMAFYIKEHFLKAFPDIGEELWNNIFDEVYTPDNIHPVFFEKLPFIPINIIINTSPDLLVKQIFEEKAGISGTQSSYYDYRSNSRQNLDNKKLRDPDINTPIIYNLFGTVTDPGSTVYSPEVLLEYVFSMLSRGQEEINSLIYNEIKSAKYFIFLGFDFESWHLKLLLRFFDIKRGEKENKVTYARPWNLEKEETQQYFKRLFNVTFVKDNIIDFISEMHNKCLADNTIQLRKPKQGGNMHPESTQPTKESLYNLLRDNKIPEALEKMENYSILIRDQDLRTKCILLMQNFNDLNMRFNQRFINDADYVAERNAITVRTSQLVGTLDLND